MPDAEPILRSAYRAFDARDADARSEGWVRRVHEHLAALESPAAATI
jgi:hypothetical protein